MSRTATILISLTLLASATTARAATEAPHLELELEGRDYRALIEQQPQLVRPRLDIPSAFADLSDLLALGKRNLDFLDHLNSKRPADQKLALTSPALQPGYPIDAPKESSPRIIRERKAAIEKEIPAELGAILFQNQSFPDRLTLSDEEYLTWARKVDGVYQGAARWKLQEPYMESYKARRAKDVRGFYHLTRVPDWRDLLARWDSLTAEEKSQRRAWVFDICLNAVQSASDCRTQVTAAEREPRGILTLAERHLPGAQRLWDSYFKLGGRRSDINWRRDNPMLATMPFKNPSDPIVRQWLIDNIEDEWRLDGWNFKLNFQTGWSWNMAEVVFEPGATPHVNGLGGNTITMDANQALQEYGTRWTIRHEFGHVLGLPDCYIEFFDTEKDVMVSYQLDLDNLMCSRRGKLQKLHYEELKRAYFR
jgi:hypothetical protein